MSIYRGGLREGRRLFLHKGIELHEFCPESEPRELVNRLCGTVPPGQYRKTPAIFTFGQKKEEIMNGFGKRFSVTGAVVCYAADHAFSIRHRTGDRGCA